ncbi:MAG: UDP-N-acetylmuramoyl-L-alanyl-D-glutamate--2,6-diaminopimelate ligase [Pseudomonadales bacterium]
MMAAIEQQNIKCLGDLIAADDKNIAAITVADIKLDSRLVCAGDLFLACKGHAVDGRNFIDQAIAAGAAAVVADKDALWPENTELQGVPIIVMENLNLQLSAIAGNFFGQPSTALSVVAVTGTNGKTTCTQLMMQLLNRLHKSCAVIGTLGTGVEGDLDVGINTTPDAVSVQAHLAQWCEDQVNTVVMEVSSHGLEQGRVAALQFELALFTNLSRDHLDYHGSMQAYAEAKASLFRQSALQKAVINSDDAFAETLFNIVAADVDIFSYSIQPVANDKRTPAVWVENIAYHSEGVKARLHSPWGQFELNSPLLGAFNLSNVVAVIASLGALGYPVSIVVDEIAGLKTVVGRMERVTSAAAGLCVVVDYAHTPDALLQALQAMRNHTQGQLWCVFGCGGDRDQGKRFQMGAVAQRFADHVVVTSDNPRTESARTIIDEILSGVDCPTLVEEDRARAIEFAIVSAAPGDSVLIAGKGHEDYQLIGAQRFPFSDIKQARLALSKRTTATGYDSQGEDA